MSIVVLQVITIGALFIFTVYEWGVLRFSNDMGEEQGEVSWCVISERIGVAKWNIWNLFKSKSNPPNEVGLSEGCYFLGNRGRDEIYVDSSGPRIKLYVNVQKENVFLTVLKGHISINNHTIYPNKTTRLEIMEFSKIRMADVELQFSKRRGWH